jgi:hypothetical protein
MPEVIQESGKAHVLKILEAFQEINHLRKTETFSNSKVWVLILSTIMEASLPISFSSSRVPALLKSNCHWIPCFTG